MNGEWFCSESCAGRHADDGVDRAAARDDVRTRALPRLKLGLVLVHHGAITPVQLRAALASQRETGRRLGEELVSLGWADAAAVVKALATQAGVPCLPALEPAAVRYCPELGAQAVRALGLVPFGVDVEGQRVKVACAAPVPRLAVGAFRELTGWTADVFLVPDHVMPSLVDAYAALAPVERERDAIVSRAAAGRRIAAVAATIPGAVVSQAACDPWLWVRVSGDAAARDLFIPTGKEGAWQAAHTSL